MGLKGRELKHKRIRRKVMGSKARPRLCLFRSLNNLYANLIDDIERKTLFSLSTMDKAIKKKSPKGGNVKAASVLGEEFAKKVIEKGFDKVVFDRGGYKYHGRVKALADACRRGGLKF